MLVLGSCMWLLWSYVVELLCLDTNKTVCLHEDLPLVVLVFLRHPKYPLEAESKSDSYVGYYYGCLGFL